MSMSLDEALKHARHAHAYGLDLSYDADEDALSTMYDAYVELKKKYEQLVAKS